MSSYWTVPKRQDLLDGSGKPSRVPLIPNKAQQIIWSKIEERLKKKQPIRLAILKARQLGISTFVCALAQHYAMTHPDVYVLSIADKLDLPRQWLRRAKIWYNQTPAPLRPHLAASNAKELFFDLLQSRYYIASAEGKLPGTGFALQFLHYSEVGYWQNADSVQEQTFASVPRSGIIIIESTGNQVGDWWYNFYYRAKEGISNFEAIFLPWYLEPSYAIKGAKVDDLTPYEENLLRAGATIEQIAWRREYIQSKLAGDEEKFTRQFPATEQEAFRSGGKNVFTAEQVAQAYKTVREPAWRGEILTSMTDNPRNFKLVESEGGSLQIFEKPNPNYHYCIGADVQWGESEASDYDAAFVECLETGKVAAFIMGRWQMPHWAQILAALGYYYNTATIAPERNSVAAEGVIWTLLGRNYQNWRYPKIYVSAKMLSLRSTGRIEDYGWKTTNQTKTALVAFTMKQTAAGEMDWAVEVAVRQMAAWITDEKTLTLTHPAGQHDDALMARMITAYVAQQLRNTVELYSPPPKIEKIDNMAQRVARQAGLLENSQEDEQEEIELVEV